MIKGGMMGAFYEKGDPEYELGIYYSMDMVDLIHILAEQIVGLRIRVNELEEKRDIPIGHR